MARRSSRPRKTARPAAPRVRTQASSPSLGHSLYHRPLRLEPLEDRRLLAVVTVTTLADSVNFNDGVTSLREAIFATNTVAGADTINFAPSLTAGGPATILLTVGELQITDSLTINGPGANLLTIDASGKDSTPDQDNGDGIRIFNVDNGNQVIAANVAINGLTLTGGDVAGNGGGAIFSRENLSVADCVVRGNNAGSGIDFVFGGGIRQLGGELQLSRSVVSGNRAAREGGGIHVGYQSNLIIEESIISENQARAGGGLSISNSNSSITGSLILANRADYGGGVMSRGFGRTTRITNSTITGNVASQYGGSAVLNYAATTILEHSTVTNNSANFGGSILVSWDSRDSTVILDHSIVANSKNLSGDQVSDFSSSSSDFGARAKIFADYSLIETPGAAPIVGANNLFNVDPLLALLADNGGPTLTHALLPSSPAINAGDPSALAGQNGVPEFDQRGTPYSRVFGDRIDIGAFEYQVTVTSYWNVDSLVDEFDGNLSRGNFSLREAIFLATFDADYSSNLIQFDSSLFAGGPATILLTQGELRVTDSLTIKGPGADLLTIDASGNDPTPDSTLEDGGWGADDRDGSRVFRIDDGKANRVQNTSISGVRLTGGDIYGDGGAIFSRENLTITGSIISGNSVVGDGRGFGGAIYAGSGSINVAVQLTIRDSDISYNASNTIGGGIATSRADTTISGSDIYRNTAGRAGGIWSALGSLVMSDSKVRYNYSKGNGGGLSLNGESATITGTIIEHNYAGEGGGIAINSGALTVQNSSISGNIATSSGGGIRNTAATLAILGSQIANNSAGRYGGGVYGNASVSATEILNNSVGYDGGGIWGDTLSISDTTISANRARRNGGGVYSRYGSVTLVNSTVDSNTSYENGGGVFLRESNANAEIRQSTISGNQGKWGGGLYNFAWYGTTMLIQQSTFTNNSAELGGGMLQLGGSLQLDHTIVARNGAILGGDLATLSGSTMSVHFSLIGDNAFSGLAEAPFGSPDANGNLIGGTTHGTIDPLLGGLIDNGGPTPTHALKPGSPAINAGDPTAAASQNGVPEFDQRGFPFTRIVGGRIDMGAIESQPNPLPGDYNFDGIVNVLDYTVWRNTLGDNYYLQADGDNSGEVDEADFSIWKQHFGQTLPLGAGGLAAAQSIDAVSEIQPPRAPDSSGRPGATSAQQVVAQTLAPARQPPARPGVAPVARVANSHAATHDDALLAWLSDRHDVHPRDEIDPIVDQDTDDPTTDAANPSDTAFAVLP